MVSKKSIFWQSFLVAVLIFAIGITLGVYFEQIRNDKASIISYSSEISLFDTLSWINLAESSDLSLQEAVRANMEFANKIYNEARELEKYDDSTKMTESIKIIHRRYDLLRTILWINTIKLRKQYPELNYVVYLYKYDSQDIEQRARQATFSRVLIELKERNGDGFVLIPIAVNSNISSLDYLMSHYNLTEVPVILINENIRITEIPTVQELERYLK